MLWASSCAMTETMTGSWNDGVKGSQSLLNSMESVAVLDEIKKPLLQVYLFNLAWKYLKTCVMKIRCG